MMTEFKRTQRDYPLSFKIAVVEQVEKGEMTYKQAQHAKWHLNRSWFGIRIDHDLASISDHSLASQSITIWHASDH